jgi:16S rRNA processing protein RimM
VGAPFGLKGFVKVQPLSGESGHLERLNSVVLRQGTAERTWEVEETARNGSVLLMKFKGIDTPEAAKVLRGAELVTGRDHGAPLGRDEFYVEDLRGMAVAGDAEDSDVLGEITDVLDTSGGSLVEIRLPSGELRLVPFRNEFLGDINLETRRAVLLNRWILE